MAGRLYLRLVQRHLALVVFVLALTVAAGAALYVVAEPRYRGSVTFSVQSAARSTDPSEVYQAELLSQARAQTYGRLFSSADVAARLRKHLPAGVSTRRIEHDLVVSTEPGSVLVRVRVTDQDSEIVRSVLAGLVVELPKYTTELQPLEDERLTTLQVAARPGVVERVAPSRTRYGGLALLGGLLAAFLAAVLRESANRRVRDSDDARTVLGDGVPVLDFRMRSRRRAKADLSPILLSTVLAVAGVRRHPVLVVSVNGGKRAAAQVYELGRRLASPEQRVVLLDLDLDARHLSALVESSNPQLIVHELEGAGASSTRSTTPVLRVVPADVIERQGASGSAQRARVDQVGHALGKVNERVRPAADVVLASVGTVLRRTRAAQALGEGVDAIVLAERGRTSAAALQATVEVVALLGARVGAVVLVDASSRRLS